VPPHCAQGLSSVPAGQLVGASHTVLFSLSLTTRLPSITCRQQTGGGEQPRGRVSAACVSLHLHTPGRPATTSSHCSPSLRWGSASSGSWWPPWRQCNAQQQRPAAPPPATCRTWGGAPIPLVLLDHSVLPRASVSCRLPWGLSARRAGRLLATVTAVDHSTCTAARGAGGRQRVVRRDAAGCTAGMLPG
jgi:hypothetical protein